MDKPSHVIIQEVIAPRMDKIAELCIAAGIEFEAVVYWDGARAGNGKFWSYPDDIEAVKNGSLLRLGEGHVAR